MRATRPESLLLAPLLLLPGCGERAPNARPGPGDIKSDLLKLHVATLVEYAGYTPAVVDIDLDGYEEPLGTVNLGEGELTALSPELQGLDGLFAPGRVHRDGRLADLDGDGYPDLIANTYSPVSKPWSTARLYLNNGDLTFREDLAFRKLDIRGFGETIVVADFDNDGDVDVFIPYYSFNDPSEQCYLLINDGKGGFVDQADRAGVALRNWPFALRPEGAQAVDFDGDGFIDLYVGSHLFLNNGDLTFTDVREAVGLPLFFDEGAKFSDWNNDGLLDLVLQDPYTGPALFEFDGTRFVYRDVMPRLVYNNSFGLNIGDLNNDGREDLVVGASQTRSPQSVSGIAILLNHPSGFVPVESSILASVPDPDLIALADLDRDGRIDVLIRNRFTLIHLHNQASLGVAEVLRVTVLGARGEMNQYGRVVRIRRRDRPDAIYTRVVDGGSGYLSQNPYELVVPVPDRSTYEVEVSFAMNIVRFAMDPGEGRRVHADGRVESY